MDPKSEAQATARLSVEDFERMLETGELSSAFGYELVDGRPVERMPASWPHGRVAVNIAHQLRMYLDQHGGGTLYSDPGVVLPVAEDREQVRGPDVAFVSDGALASAGGERPRGFSRVVPDLVAEVVSPDDAHAEVQQKVREYLAAGVRLVWVIDPTTRQAVAYRPDGTARLLLSDDDTLEGEDVLPGLQVTLGALLR